MICVSIKAETNESTLSKIDEAKRLGADLVEIRLDYIKNPEIRLLISKKSLPAIITVRPLWEGGNFSGSEDERVALLHESASLGAEYIDIEFKAYKDFDRKQSKLVLSYHEFEHTPQQSLISVYRKMELLKPDIIKIAVQANSVEDILNIAKLQLHSKIPSCIFAMGEMGIPTRILYKKLGGFLTYAALKRGEETAHGQISLQDLIEIYRVKEISSDTKVYGVIGNPVSHSKSPQIFNSIFQEEKIDAVYLPFAISDISLIKEIVRVFDIKGLSVTTPHKISILKFLDDVDLSASEIGAINTVIIKESKLMGFNTDCDGAIEAIKLGVKNKFGSELNGKTALVIGAGGVARAIVYGLLKHGVKVTIANRTFDKAKKLSDEMGSYICDYSQLKKINADIIINATSCGMEPYINISPVDKGIFKKNMVVFDSVYTPKKTKFLKDAKDTGAEIIYGTDLFINQLALQYKIFFGKELPINKMKNIYSLTKIW